MNKDAENKGSIAEKLLADFLSNKIFSHYVYLNPGIGSEEICDVLILLKNRAVVLQVKNKNLSKDDLYKDKDIKKNAKQCRGAAKFLSSSKKTIPLQNQAGINESVDLSQIDEVYCISVMHQDAAWFGFYDDSKAQKVHIINFASLQKVFGELNTLPELFQYLSDKEKLFCSDKRIMLSGGEEELFALWIDGERSYKRFEKVDAIFTNEGIYKQLVNSKNYKTKKSEDKKYGKYWNQLILTTQALGSNYKVISDELANEDSLHRRLLGASYGEFIGYAIENKKPSLRMTHYSASPSDSPQKLYIFLFMGEANDEGWREKRKMVVQLQAEIFVRKYYSKHKSLKQIIGVATDSVFSEASGFDFMMIEINPEFIKHCESTSELDDLSKQFDILQVEPRLGTVHEYEEGFEIEDY